MRSGVMRRKASLCIQAIASDLEKIDQYHLNDLTRKTERYIKRKIRTLVLDDVEFKSLEANLKQPGMMLLLETSEK
jgi:hypothetical protein